MKEPEKTFDPLTVEVFYRSRSLRPWRAVGRKFNRCTTLIKLTLQPRGSSNPSNRTTATRMPKMCSNLCQAITHSSSSSLWRTKFQVTKKNKTRHLATSCPWAQALTCPCKCLCQCKASPTSSIEIASHEQVSQDTLQSQVIDWLHLRVNQPQPWSKQSFHSRQKDPSNRWTAWSIWWVGRQAKLACWLMHLNWTSKINTQIGFSLTLQQTTCATCDRYEWRQLRLD